MRFCISGACPANCQVGAGIGAGAEAEADVQVVANGKLRGLF